MNLYKNCNRLILAHILVLSFIVLPEAWSLERFEMDPLKVAAAETRVWRVSYANDYTALRQELENLVSSQFGISEADTDYIGEQLANATVKFAAVDSNYKSTVLPYIELAYSRLKQILDVSFDSKEVAGAELDWWVARRTPGGDSVDDVGRLITRLYVQLFGEDNLAFARAGLLRAQASRLRDEGGALCNWDVVENLLQKSYQALQEGLEPALNNHSAQVVLSWDPNKEADIAGYKIYYGSSSGDYGPSVDVGNRTNFTITGLENGKTYYFVTTAYNNLGSESAYSAEIVHKAAVNVKLHTRPNISSDENALQYGESGKEWKEAVDSEIQTIEMPLLNPEIVWLPQEINLTKRYKGSFQVSIRIEGAENLKTPTFFPRLKYYIGTGSSYGYFDMMNKGDGVWQFDIPDPGWFKYRSKYLHYQVKMFGQNESVILESSTKVEFIDSFAKD